MPNDYADNLASLVFVGVATDEGRWAATLFSKISIRHDLTFKQMLQMRGVIEQYCNMIWTTPVSRRESIYSVKMRPNETFEHPDGSSDMLIRRLALCWSANVVRTAARGGIRHERQLGAGPDDWSGNGALGGHIVTKADEQEFMRAVELAINRGIPAIELAKYLARLIKPKDQRQSFPDRVRSPAAR